MNLSFRAAPVFQPLDELTPDFPIIGKRPRKFSPPAPSLCERGRAGNGWKMPVLALLTGLLTITAARAESLRGDMNGWAATWMILDDLIGNTWTLTFTNTLSDGSANFKFDQDGDWDPQWGSGTGSQNASANASVGQVRCSCSGEGPGNMTIGMTLNKIYTWKLTGTASWWDRQFIAMETDAWPVDLTAVSDNAAAAGTGTVTVSIQLSAAKSPQETVYVRYTTNGWTADLVAATGSSTNYTATIPGQAAGVTVVYYAISSTMPLALVGSSTDLCILRGNNNAGANYSYVVSGGFNPGNCWHVPGNYEPQGAYMRNPPNPYSNTAVHIYNGNQFQGVGNPGNQTGGVLHHRLAPAGAWSSTNLAFDIERENNKYWKSAIPPGAYGATNGVEYYLQISYSDHDTTWIGTSNNAVSALFASEAEAMAHPFSFIYGGEPGSEAGFIWHASNRVSAGSGNVQFWAKIGYAQGTGSNRWVNNAVIYYTTNGAAPAGAKGVAGNADTFVQTMGFDHMEEDSYPDGDAMWWAGTATNLPASDGSVIRYKIGAWNGGGVERFAEYNTSEPDNKIFDFSLFVPGAAGLQVNGQSADYTTTKFFIDELAGETQYVTVVYTPADGAISNVQVFCNLNRRDWVDVDYTNQYIASDGYPDGIRPPDGNLLNTNDTGAYFTAFVMSGGPSTYYWTGAVSQCGAYRLTARYQKNAASPTNWNWYSSSGRRDHAVVASPKKVHDLTMYELNTLTIKATSDTEGGHSTFSDLLTGNQDSFTNFNLGYLNKIQANCLWFQPIHPNGIDRADGLTPGSPYATRDYFAVSKWFGKAGTEEGALNEFTNFVQACDVYTGQIGTVNIMLDGVFNHTSWDAEFGEAGVRFDFCTNVNDRIGWFKPGWYSLWTDYGSPATYYSSAWSNDIATAPDRGDFGKWNDVAEFYYGKYSALVRHNPDNNADYLNEDDGYDFAGMGTDTKDLWKYIGYYSEYWLKKTGHSGTNSTAADGSYAQRLARDNRGIDGLRCDFGQGLPPQCWEYVINRTRKMKWNFVFMAETLDGGKPGYRSNRHFDVLNENIVFKFTQEHIGNSWDIKQALESRRTAYSGGGILLNLTGHDEVIPESDCWMTASRYGAMSMSDGIPMIFYGQEKGIQPYSEATQGPNLYYTGFKKFEVNFGKSIPNFKEWNQLTVWEQLPPNGEGMDQWYGRVNWARLNSPALRSMNRYFLARTGGGDNARILAAAKYETPYASPANSDVVLAFALVLNNTHDDAQDIYNLQPCWDLLGLNTGRYYNVRNLASSDASAYVWPASLSGQELWNNGVYVHLTADKNGSQMTDDGALVQFLKLVETDGPTNRGPQIVFTPPGPFILPVGSTTNFTVSVTDPDGNPVTTNMTVAPAGAAFVNGIFSWTVGASVENSTNVVAFVADDQQGLTNSIVTNSTTVTVPFDWNANAIGDGWEWIHFGNLTNTAATDNDGDHVGDYDEYVAGTQPTNPGSYFTIRTVTQGGSTNRLLTIPTVSGRLYRVFFTDNHYGNSAVWSAFGNPAQGIGTWQENNPTGTFTFTDDESANTTSNAPAGGNRLYRIRVEKL
ncbi:MAG TPA: hypothetical protein DCZ95_18600 [Verrucomicrobia bacterium]|nr:MAG: hypothetical protein A2X46_14960 [Lentisphaerae bacterium GWF2_57_35]HBA86099.1 hypothetical protein [Verrucomicrobiota bacterium]